MLENLPSILSAVKTMDLVCDGHWLVMPDGYFGDSSCNT